MKTKKSSSKIAQNWQRKLILGITSFVVISIMIFTMNSCSKDSEGDVTEVQYTKIQDATARVKAFKDMLQAEKKGELELRTIYTAEELIWNIEANMNYTYAEAGLKYDDYYEQTDTIDVPELGGPMPSTVVSRVNDEVLGIVKCIYHNTGFPNKKLKLVDVFPIVGQNAIGVTTVVGNFISIWDNEKRFQPGQDFNMYRGYCDGSLQNKVAVDEIAKYATWNLVTSYALEAGIWYSDIGKEQYSETPEDLVWFGDNANDPNPGDWVIDYFMFWADICDETLGDDCVGDDYQLIKWLIPYHEKTEEYIDATCIDWDEMNYYLDNAETECLKFEPILLKKFLHLKMWVFRDDYPSIGDKVFWEGEGYYGKKNIDIDKALLTLGDCN